MAAGAAFIAAIAAFLLSRQVGAVLVGREDAAAIASYFGLGVFPLSYPWLTEKLTARQLGSTRATLPPGVFRRPWFVVAALTGLLLAAISQLATFAMGFLGSLILQMSGGVGVELSPAFVASLLAGSWIAQIVLAFFMARTMGNDIERRHAPYALPLLVVVALGAVLTVDRIALAIIGFASAPLDWTLITIQAVSWLIAAIVGYVSGPRLPELSYLARALPVMPAPDREALVALTYAHVLESPRDSRPNAAAGEGTEGAAVDPATGHGTRQ